MSPDSSPKIRHSRGVSLLKSVARIALAVVIGATLLLVILEKQMIYFPAATLDVTPQALGLPAEEVLIDVEPGVKIHGWFIRAAKEPSVATVLFSHGNAGNIADRLDRVLHMRGLGVDVLLYDYRGFGRSTGSPDEEGTYRDGRAAYDYLARTRGIEPARLVLMGESLGCAISVQLALERKAAGLVLEAPFASIRHMAAAVYPFLPLGPFIRTRYDNLAKIPQVKVPLLVVQGTLDEIIPVRQGRMVFDAAPAPKTFLAIEGAHHNDVYPVGGDRYLRALSDFIGRGSCAPHPYRSGRNGQAMNHYLLIYELADDYLSRRGEFRGVHLNLAWAAHERGELVLGGALAEPVDRALLMFKGESPKVAEDFAKVDPYVLNGLIKSWSVRPWPTVIGDGAANPVRP